jgi:hypothetical protein
MDIHQAKTEANLEELMATMKTSQESMEALAARTFTGI